MACMSHYCGHCHVSWDDNKIHNKCPYCGWGMVSNQWDEEHSHDQEPDQDVNEDD
jgi:hypothetical protein